MAEYKGGTLAKLSMKDLKRLPFPLFLSPLLADISPRAELDCTPVQGPQEPLGLLQMGDKAWLVFRHDNH